MSQLLPNGLTRIVSLVAILSVAAAVGCQTPRASASGASAPVEGRVGTSGASSSGRARATATAAADGGSVAAAPGAVEDKNDRIPDWVINPGLGGVIGAVGVAPPKGMGTKEQLDEARLNARIELVTMLEGRVQRSGRTELEEDYRATADDRSEDSRKNILGIDRNILDGVLAGTRQRALWFDPQNGEVYVWIVLDGSVLDGVDHHVTDSVSVFRATAAVTSEYRPKRRRPGVPVEVRPPGRPAAPPAPENAVDELEGKLKDIETIPSKQGDSGSGSEKESAR